MHNNITEFSGEKGIRVQKCHHLNTVAGKILLHHIPLFHMFFFF